MNTKITRRVTVLCNMVIFLVTTGISEIFTVKALNGRSDDKQEKQAKKDYFEASDSVLEIGYFLGSNRVQREFTVKALKCNKLRIFWLLTGFSDIFTVRA